MFERLMEVSQENKKKEDKFDMIEMNSLSLKINENNQKIPLVLNPLFFKKREREKYYQDKKNK